MSAKLKIRLTEEDENGEIKDLIIKIFPFPYTAKFLKRIHKHIEEIGKFYPETFVCDEGCGLIELGKKISGEMGGVKIKDLFACSVCERLHRLDEDSNSLVAAFAPNGGKLFLTRGFISVRP